jgi:hypothetical protein
MKNFVISTVMATTFLAVQWVQAASICDVKNGLQSARESLVAMLDAADKAAQEELKKKVDEASTSLETAVEAMLGDANTSEDNKGKLNQFKETWTAFKDTRETEIVPAIYAGKQAEAKALATGIQAERMTTMQDLLKELGGDNCEAAK